MYSHLFFHEKQEELACSRQPGGPLVVQNMINGQPYWKNINLESRQKKTLIIADWTISAWKMEKKWQFQSQMALLQEEGFKIYFWQAYPQSRFFLEYKNKINRHQRTYMLPTLPSTIIKEAISQLKDSQLTADKIFILDDHWIDCLLDPDKDITLRHVSEVALKNLPLKSLPGLPGFLQKLSPPVTLLMEDTFGAGNTQECSLAIAQIKALDGMQTSQYFREASFYNDEILKLLSQEAFVESGKTFSWENLRQVEECLFFKCPLDIGENQLKTFFSAMPNLKSLYSDFEGNFPNLVLDQVKEWTWEGKSRETSSQNLDSFCQALPNLFKIFLSKADLSTKALALSFQHLKKIAFVDCQLLTDQLLFLLKNCPNLQSIDLKRCLIKNPGSRDANPIHVKKILIKNCTFVDSDLGYLIENAVRLESMEVFCTATPAFSWASVNLPALKFLILNFVTLSPLFLTSIFRRTLVLEELILSDCKFKDAYLGEFSDLKLDHLVDIRIQRTPIDALILLGLLEKSKNLQRLVLADCHQLELSQSQPVNLENLANFIATNCSFSPSFLSSILSTSLNLQSLNVEKSKFSSGFFEEAFPLKNLRQLNARNSEMTPFLLGKILQDAKNLIGIDLTNCKHLYHFQDNWQLPNLISLSLTGTPLSWHDLQQLIGGSLYLRNLDIFGTKVNKLGELNCLETLSLNAETEITARLPDLKSLTLYLPSKKTSQKLPTGLRTEDLALIGSEKHFTYLENRQFLALLSPFPGIKTLSLHKLVCLDESVDSLFFPELTELCIFWSIISNAHLKMLIKNSPKLKKVTFKAVTPPKEDAELDALLKNLGADPIDRLKPAATASKTRPVTTLDADTKKIAGKTFNEHTIFYPYDGKPVESVSLYRKNVYDKIQINPQACALQDAFKLEMSVFESALNPLSIQEKAADLYQFGKTLLCSEKNRRLVYAKEKLDLTAAWQGIPSLSRADAISHYHLSSKTKVAFAYSSLLNLYFIRSLEGNKTVELDYLLTFEEAKSQAIIPPEIKALIKEKQGYGEGALHLESPNPTGFDYLKALKKDKKGACRHRTLVFKEEMQRCHPDIPVHIVNNGCHSFIEMQIDKDWIRCDLGGYQAELNISDSYNPLTASKVDSHLDMFRKTYETRLETWHKAKPIVQSVNAYCHELLNPTPSKKRLIELTSTADVENLHLSLQAYCAVQQRPCFYVHSPDDLIVSAPYIARAGSQGLLKKGPGGPLYDFLTHSGKNGSLIINYDNFSAEDIVRFNGLLDKKRQADGCPLPENCEIIGLMNTAKVDCYQGSDFYSRFGQQTQVNPLSSSDLKAHIAQRIPFNLPEKTASVASVAIHLFHSPCWKDILMGQWILKGDHLFYEEGALKAAIASGLTVELHNAPLADPEFRLFWKMALLKGYAESRDERVDVPACLQLVHQEGYDWQLLAKGLSWQTGLKTGVHCLNPGLFAELFNRYEVDNANQRLQAMEGLIKAHANQTLELNLTRELSMDNWGQMLFTCQKYAVSLNIQAADNCALPDFLKPWCPVLEVDNPATNLDDSVRLIISTDRDYSLQAFQETGEWLVLDVSGCEINDLFEHIDGKFDKESLRLVFNHLEQAALTALKQHKNVLLKGQFSQKLADALAPLILARPGTGLGKLVILADNKEAFAFCPQEIEEVTAAMKISACPAIEKLGSALIEKESLAQLKARLAYLQRCPESIHSDHAWQGMHHLPSKISLENLDEENYKARALAFTQNRLEAVLAILDANPFVYLTGLTAVGKTTFVEKNLASDDRILYAGEKKLQSWAKSTKQGLKILFIDEANIGNKQWSNFEGLYHEPPGILIEGIYYPLTKEHKVVFAGNPVSYGQRNLPALFERHGNGLVFEPLSLDFIFADILKPVFEGTPFENRAIELCKPIFHLYRYLVEISEDTVLISPRELQMAALLALADCQASDKPLADSDLQKAARKAIYMLAKDLVPKDRVSNFEQIFKPLEASSVALKPQKNKGKEKDKVAFIETPSRKAVRQNLENLLNLRQLRQKAKDLNPVQRAGGLGGVIIEGEPGIGKSELVLNCLKKQGLKKAGAFANPERNFYYLPVSMQTREKKKLLLKAFEEGAVVVIDEINASAMMEGLLNHLLMGKNVKGKDPRIPGFMVIGTQNPVTMKGRRKASNALARRMMQIQLPAYTRLEMQQILALKGLAKRYVVPMVQAYEDNLNKAIAEKLEPLPTFRDLAGLADQVIAEHQALFKMGRAGSLRLSEKLAEDCLQIAASYEQWAFFDSLLQRQQVSVSLMQVWFVKALEEKLDPVFQSLCAMQDKAFIEGQFNRQVETRNFTAIQRLGALKSANRPSLEGINAAVKSLQPEFLAATPQLKPLFKQLNKLDEKAEELVKRKEAKAAETVRQLTANIRKHLLNLVQPDYTFHQAKLSLFQKKTQSAIHKAHPELSRHRGIKQDLVYLAAAILDLLTLSLTCWVVNHAFFKVKTETEKRVDKLQNALRLV